MTSGDWPIDPVSVPRWVMIMISIVVGSAPYSTTLLIGEVLAARGAGAPIGFFAAMFLGRLGDRRPLGAADDRQLRHAGKPLLGGSDGGVPPAARCWIGLFHLAVQCWCAGAAGI